LSPTVTEQVDIGIGNGKAVRVPHFWPVLPEVGLFSGPSEFALRQDERGDYRLLGNLMFSSNQATTAGRLASDISSSLPDFTS
jgi:hypothetical protein